MSQISIEDKIIAYFENRLSDDDRAELLHRVSVSPEIRRVFREHEMLRSMALEARGSAVIGAGVETALFEKINQLANTKSDKAAGWLPGFRSYASEAAFVMAAILAMLMFRETAVENRADRAVAKASLAEAARVVEPADVAAGQSTQVATAAGETTSKADRPNTSYSTYKTYPPTEVTDPVEVATQVVEQPQEPTLSPAPIRSISASIGESRPLIAGLLGIPVDRSDNMGVELSITSTSGFFASPADRGSGAPFGDVRFRAQYEITEGVHVGVGLQSGHFLHLVEPVVVKDQTGFESIERPMDYERNTAYELFAKYRIMLPVGRNIPLDLSVGGGLIPNGSLLSSEIGVQFPISQSLAVAPSFSLLRVHSSADRLEALTPKKSDVPMIISGSEQRNTIQGAINIGLSYRF